MKGDFSRFTFQRDRHYSSVLMQQGRVQLDADWNEQVDILAHLRNTEARDVIGASGVPHTGGGFLVSAAGDNLSISGGRLYVDGMLVENESTVLYKVQPNQASQPHYPVPANWQPGVAGIYLVYLDVWQRHMTALEDPAIREVALGGPDTATRTQVIWQVRLSQLPVAELDDNITCWDVPSAWEDLVARVHGRLSARTQVAETETNPCILPAGAGYRRLENQLYRVEIHDPGVAGSATFKWSRDNGMVVTRLLKIDAIDSKVLSVADTGRDAVLGFAAGQWVEVSDEPRLLRGEPGVLVRIKDVVENIIEIVAWSQSAPNTQPPLDLDTATLRRWDHTSSEPALSVIGSSDTDVWIDLEDGVQVRFEGDINYETGDYWLIPARTVSAETLGGDIEWPRDPDDAEQPAWLPPQGVAHHYARLALLAWDGEAFEDRHDCRLLFPALTEPDLYYISGDGQEAMPGDTLPQVLSVGVSNCNRPIEGAWVKFELYREGEGGDGSLQPESGARVVTRFPDSGPIIKWFIAATNPAGEAACAWQLQSRGSLGTRVRNEAPTLPAQQVRATLLQNPTDLDALKLDRPVVFSASFGVAWENQFGGSDFPDAQHPTLEVQTVEDALDQLRENVALYYVGGEGQVIAPGPRGDGEEPARYARLPAPLEVRVANGDWPYRNAQVRFTIEAGDGSLSLDDGPIDDTVIVTSITVATDPSGIARGYWALDRNTPVQRVTAELISAGAIAITSPSRITFRARLVTADQITYDGSDFPDDDHPSLEVDTVEEALDQLRENTALHYVSGDGQETVPGQQLAYPLQVRVANGQWPRAGAQVQFNATEGTLQGGSSSGPSVTVESGPDGVAECTWTPDANGSPSQQVMATLRTPTQLPGSVANPLPGVVRFNANLSQADQVYYDPNAESLAVNPPQNVQGAIDELYAMKVNRAGDTMTGDLRIQTNLLVGGHCTITGNLIVNGDTTTVNTAELTVEDRIILVNNYDPSGHPPAALPLDNDAGLEVFRGGVEPNAQLIWDEGEDAWKIGKAGDLHTVIESDGGVLVRGNRNLSGLGDSLVFNGDWQFDLDGIAPFFGNRSQLRAITVTDSTVGGKALRVNGYVAFVMGDLIPFDRDAMYVFDIVARQQSEPSTGENLFWFGGAGYLQDGQTLCNISGTNSPLSQHYVAVSGTPLPAGWTRYTGYLRGAGVAGTFDARTDPATPGVFHNGVRFFRPIVYINYENGNGTALIASLRVHRLHNFAGADDGQMAVTGVVVFTNLPLGQEMVSNDIDPGFGAAAVCVQLGVDEDNSTSVADSSYRLFIYRAEVNRNTGRFRIFVLRRDGAAATVRLRWWAIKPRAGETTATVTIGVSVATPSVTLGAGGTRTFTATVIGTTNPNVNWSTNGGSITPAGVYTAPATGGSFVVTAASVADPSQQANATVAVFGKPKEVKEKDKDKEKEKDFLDVPVVFGKGPTGLELKSVAEFIAPVVIDGSPVAGSPAIGRAFITPDERPDLSQPPGGVNG